MISRRATVATLLIFSLCGCATVGSSSSVIINKREGYSQQVQDVIVPIKVDGIPGSFTAPLLTHLHADLQQHNVTADVRAISELDLSPLRNEDVQQFTYAMFCTPTKTFSNQYALKSVTMNCTLSETRTHLIVMKMDATAYKGFGYGFGDNEAEHLAQGIVEKMQEADLIAALPAQGSQP